MANYQIITDSGSDLSRELAEQLKVTVIPLTVNFNDQVFPDRNDDSLKEIYASLRNGGMSTTSAVNPQGWVNGIRPIVEAGEDVVVVTFSSGLSTTYQSAVIAAAELMDEFPSRKIYVCDSLAASLGQGLLVYYACKLRDSGADALEVVEWIQMNRLHLCHLFTVDDLGFLKRGGRISAATAVLGSMMSIKPVLHVDNDGKLINVSKERGRKAALKAMVNAMKEKMGSYDNSVVFISHGDCLEDAQKLADMVQKETGAKDVVIGYVGAVIGSHSGPGTLALFFMGNTR